MASPAAVPGSLHVLIIGAGTRSPFSSHSPEVEKNHVSEQLTNNLQGVTGLLLAQALKKDGIAYSIFDAEDELTRKRTREWGMSIHWSRPFLNTILPAGKSRPRSPPFFNTS